MQLELSTGLTLTAQPVSQIAIDAIYNELGGYAEMSRQAEMTSDELGDYIRALPYAERIKREAAQHKQMVYLFGWGIAESPDDDAVAQLEALGCNSTIPQIQRANWLIYTAGLSRADKALIIGTIMTITRMAQ